MNIELIADERDIIIPVKQQGVTLKRRPIKISTSKENIMT